MFNPLIIGPSYLVQYNSIKKGGFKNFICICGAIFKDEMSYRNHLNMMHKMLNDKINAFGDIAIMGRLVNLDFALLGDLSKREEYEELLGSEYEQKVRINKLLWIRDTIKCSSTTQQISEKDKK
jgi:hypothetical protein